MKNKFITIILLFFFTITSLYASGSNNPKDSIYENIDYWNATGLIDRLPPIRPYPAQYIISVLQKVINIGTPEDVKIATQYLEYYTTNNMKFILKHNSFTSFDEYQTLSGPGIDANLYINKYVTADIDINAFILNGIDKEVTAPSRNIGIDLNVDNMGFSAFGKEWELQQGLNMNSAFGTDKIWFQSGMMPSSFGPLFSDSVVLNPNAKQAAHFSTTWVHDKFIFSYLFMPIVATDNTGSNESDDKYIHIRSLDFKFTNFWEFQFYETAIYGGKGVKPIFFLPFSEFFYSAGQGGTWDVNSLMGVSSRFQFPSNISLATTVYMDDINARDVAALKLDTRYKLAAQIALNWTPKKSIIRSADLSYTAIMPYMYTHTTEGDDDSEYYEIFSNTNYDIRNFALSSYMSYENYTNAGVSMGPYGMDPNSDKTSLTLSFNLPKGFKLKYSGELQRHGNSSAVEDREYTTILAEQLENMTEEELVEFNNTYDEDGDGIYSFDQDNDGIVDEAVAIDGSIYDAGYGWTGGYQYMDRTPFLTQNILEVMILNELKLTTPSIPLFKGEIYGNIAYSYVYVTNYNLVKDNTYDGSFLSLSVNYSF